MRRTIKREWLAFIGLFLLAVVAVWSVAFFLWLFWPDIKERARPGSSGDPAPRQERPAEEQIYEGERKELEKILKRK